MKRTVKFALQPALALVLSLPAVTAQQPGQAPAGGKAEGTATTAARRLPAGALRILVLEGQDIRNSIKTKTAVSPVVQVLDSQDQPVQGANVTFEVPTTGPGGSFGTAPMATVRTDYSGQATAAFTPNAVPGTFFIKVTAVAADRKAETRIRQINDRDLPEPAGILPPKPWYKQRKWWAIMAAGAGGGIATGIILSGRSDTPTVTISPAPIGIGGPR